jgi:hypothetical protein
MMAESAVMIDDDPVMTPYHPVMIDTAQEALPEPFPGPGNTPSKNPSKPSISAQKPFWEGFFEVVPVARIATTSVLSIT